MTSAAAPADRTAEILRTVEALLIEVVGDELTLAGPITLATSFNADLELESFEFVALAEKLQQHFAVDFVAWISGKQLDEIIQLTVGELVEYVASCPS